MNEKPLIVQSDRSLLLDIHSPQAQECRNDIIVFAELVKAPEHMHTFQISPLSLWNANSAGFSKQDITERLLKWSKYDIPSSVLVFIKNICERFGLLVLLPYNDKEYLLKCKDDNSYQILNSNASLKKYLRTVESQNEERCFSVKQFERGTVKVELIKLGYPVEDMIPLALSEHIDINLTAPLRDYQQLAVDSVFGDMGPGTGYGTVVMPCGSGKTITGIASMDKLKTRTLIMCPNVISVRQWINELRNKTDVNMDLVGEYSGEKKELKPITVCTYQVLTYRPNVESDNYPHMNIIRDGNWGLVIYDEVHMLPAPVFRITAELQSVYRIGLTATLIREDGREDEVFSLVGPKRYDVPWTDLEQKGWIAKANCIEIKIPQREEDLLEYAAADKREKYKIASNNIQKIPVIRNLLEKHYGQSILIIGQYIDQLKQLHKIFGFPIITGSTANKDRERLYSDFKNGTIKVLIVSKVANYAIDLPDASVAIQVSGTFGSRQEEAQRLGRILRPKEDPCYFYTLTTQYSVEEDFSANRRKFLVEQGYKYYSVTES